MTTRKFIPTASLSDEQFGELARSILARESGSEGLLRFLNLAGNGTDYTRNRHPWQTGTTVDDILERIRQRSF